MSNDPGPTDPPTLADLVTELTRVLKDHGDLPVLSVSDPEGNQYRPLSGAAIIRWDDNARTPVWGCDDECGTCPPCRAVAHHPEVLTLWPTEWPFFATGGHA